MIPRWLPALLLAAGSAHGAPYVEQEVKDGGAIRGRVMFTGDFPKPPPLAVTRDSDVCGDSQPNEQFVVSPRDHGLKDAVVFIRAIGAGKPFTPPAAPPRIRQSRCRYEPHVQVIRPGNLDIVNQDATLHNVHAWFDPDRKLQTLFNVAQLPHAAAAKGLTQPGVVKMSCDIHSWMKGWVVVAENPYYAVTAADGSFEIRDVPPGRYTLALWHEGLGRAEKQVVVESGNTAVTDFPIGKSR